MVNAALVPVTLTMRPGFAGALVLALPLERRVVRLLGVLDPPLDGEPVRPRRRVSRLLGQDQTRWLPRLHGTAQPAAARPGFVDYLALVVPAALVADLGPVSPGVGGVRSGDRRRPAISAADTTIPSSNGQSRRQGSRADAQP